MKTERSSHRLVVLGQDAVAIAGVGLNSAEKYSLHDDQWKELHDLNVER